MSGQAWEYLYTTSKRYEDKTVEEQRDELHAAVGLLLESLRATDLATRPLLQRTVVAMGYRYGPWSR